MIITYSHKVESGPTGHASDRAAARIYGARKSAIRYEQKAVKVKIARRLMQTLGGLMIVNDYKIKMKTQISVIAILILLITISGCRQQSSPPWTEIITKEPTRSLFENSKKTTSPTQSATPTNRPSPSFTPKSTLLPTESPTAEKVCPSIVDSVILDDQSGLNDLNSSVLAFLNDGGHPNNIKRLEAKDKEYVSSSSFIDFDEDGKYEVVVLSAVSLDEGATIRIYQCAENKYKLAKTFPLKYKDFAEIKFEHKLFESRLPFLIFRATDFLGWGESYFAIGWTGSIWEIINLGGGSYPTEIALFDRDQDGTMEVFIKTPTSVSQGGGVGRTMMETWEWNGEKYMVTNFDYLPGWNRVHYLDDAEIALANGNPLLAILYYEIAARDESLPSSPTTDQIVGYQEHLAKPYQRSFSYFRIVEIWLFLDRPEIAKEYAIEMSEAFPNGTPGNEFVVAANKLIAGYERGLEFHLACEEVAIFLNENFPDVVTTHIGSWGVSNVAYFDTADYCEFGDE